MPKLRNFSGQFRILLAIVFLKSVITKTFLWTGRMQTWQHRQKSPLNVQYFQKRSIFSREFFAIEVWKRSNFGQVELRCHIIDRLLLHAGHKIASSLTSWSWRLRLIRYKFPLRSEVLDVLSAKETWESSKLRQLCQKFCHIIKYLFPLECFQFTWILHKLKEETLFYQTRFSWRLRLIGYKFPLRSEVLDVLSAKETWESSKLCQLCQKFCNIIKYLFPLECFRFTWILHKLKEETLFYQTRFNCGPTSFLQFCFG